MNTPPPRSMSSSDLVKLVKLVELDGWFEVRVTGSHHQYQHPSKPGLMTIPHHRKDLPSAKVSAVLKLAGLK